MILTPDSPTSLPVRERGLKPESAMHALLEGESLPVRERGLKLLCPAIVQEAQPSLPVRERGLKLILRSVRKTLLMSLPVRERGLKRENGYEIKAANTVAPRAGAWIEAMSDVP